MMISSSNTSGPGRRRVQSEELQPGEGKQAPCWKFLLNFPQSELCLFQDFLLVLCRCLQTITSSGIQGVEYKERYKTICAHNSLMPSGALLDIHAYNGDVHCSEDVVLYCIVSHRGTPS